MTLTQTPHPGQKFYAFAGLCILVSAIMFLVGNGDDHLTELADYAYIPLIMGGVALLRGFIQK